MRKYISFFFLILSFQVSIHAQDELPGPDFSLVVPPNPTASALGQYSDIPVGLYTGTPNIIIPLWDVKERNLSLPISLSYQNSGLKVEEFAPITGLGWSLNAGGMITRVIRGKPDEDIYGYLNTMQEDWINYCFDSEQEIKNIIEGNYIDAEPDLFIYNFNGHSGKFMIDFRNGKKVYTIPHSKYKFEYTVNSYKIVQWSVTTPEGLKYIFGTTRDESRTAIENTSTSVVCTGDAHNYSDYYSTWYLLEIISVNENSKINFYYNNNTSISYGRFVSTTKTHALGSGCTATPSIAYCYSNLYASVCLLEKIETSNLRILFSYSDRLDSDSKKLDYLEIKNKSGNLFKGYKLEYDYFGDISQEDLCRLKLSKVTEYDKYEKELPSYIFNYHDGTIPSNKEGAGFYDQDHWGYYNEKGNSTLLPAITIGAQNYPGADRSPSTTPILTTILNKITYPTGGYTEFTYESHDYGYIENTSVSKQAAGGLRIKEIRGIDGITGNNIHKYYKYYMEGNPTKSSGVLESQLPQYYYYIYDVGQVPCVENHLKKTSRSQTNIALTKGSHVGYREVHEYFGKNESNGKIIHSFTSGYDICDAGGHLFPFGQADNYDWLRGTLEKETIKDADNNLLKETVYEYIIDEELNNNKIYGVKAGLETPPPNGSTNTPLNYYKVDITNQSIYWLKLISKTEKNFASNPVDYIYKKEDYFYDNPNHTQVTRARLETNETNKYLYTNVTYAEDYTNVDLTSFIGTLKNKHIVNLPIEKVVYETNGDGNNVQIRHGKINYYKTGTWAGLLDKVYDLENASEIPLSEFKFSHKLAGHLPESPGFNNFQKDARFITDPKFTIDRYDNYGNITEYCTKNNIHTSLIWGYNNNFPVIKAENANFNMLNSAVSNACGSIYIDLNDFLNTINDLSSEHEKNLLKSFYEAIRSALPDAIVTFHTYNPLIGKTSETDPNGITTFYNYDTFGRLILIEDHEGKKIKEYSYHTQECYPKLELPEPINGPSSACEGSAVSFNVTPVNGATRYTWVMPTGSAITSGQGTTQITAILGSSSGNLSVTAGNDCESSETRYKLIAVHKNDFFMPEITGPTQVCEEDLVQYELNRPTGGSEFEWILPAGSSIIDNWQDDDGIVYLKARLYNSGIIQTIASNDCGDIASPALTVDVNNGIPDLGNINGDTHVCSGSTYTYSVNPVSEANTYIWTVPQYATIVSGQGTNEISVRFSLESGNVSVTASNDCFTSSTSNLHAEVGRTYPNPGNISGPTDVCEGTIVEYICHPDDQGGNPFDYRDYSWSLPTGSQIIETSYDEYMVKIKVKLYTSGNIRLRGQNDCSDVYSPELFVTVNSIPAKPTSISGSSSPCSGSTLNYSTPEVSGTSYYRWAVPSGSTILSGQGTRNISVNFGSTSGNVSVRTENNCGNSQYISKSVTVNSKPSAPGSITGATQACRGRSKTYSISTVSGATSYTWTVPSGATILSGQGTTSVSVRFGTGSGNVSVKASNNCGSSPYANKAVTVIQDISTIGSISGPTNVCSDRNNIYSIDPVPGATNYAWSLPSGSLIDRVLDGGRTIDVTLVNSGNISVRAYNDCDERDSPILSVTVNTKPTTPGSISGSSNICSGSTSNYSASEVSGTIFYRWTVPSGSTILSGQGTRNISVKFGNVSGNVSVKAENSCGTSSARNKYISVTSSVPSTPGAISGPTFVDPEDRDGYSISAVPGATSYSWSIISGNGASIISGQGTRNVQIYTGRADFKISVRAYNCKGYSLSRTINVTVNDRGR